MSVGNGVQKSSPGKPKVPKPTPAELDAQKKADDAAKLPEPVVASAFLKENAPLPKWLVKDSVLDQGVTVIGGVSGSGKSTLAIVTIAAALQGFKVLFIEQEGAKFFLQHKLVLGGLTPKFQKNVSVLYGKAIDLTQDDWKAHFAKIIQGFDLVVLDTLADVQSSDFAERRHARRLAGLASRHGAKCRAGLSPGRARTERHGA